MRQKIILYEAPFALNEDSASDAIFYEIDDSLMINDYSLRLTLQSLSLIHQNEGFYIFCLKKVQFELFVPEC